MPTTIHKCQCGDANCNQYTLSTQGSVGFDLPTATLYAAAEDMRTALGVFATCADEIDYEDASRSVPDIAPTPNEEWAKFRLTVGDYRKARAAYKLAGAAA